MRAPNFRSVGPTVQPAERKQTHTQTDATENITSSANAGGNDMQMFSGNIFATGCRSHMSVSPLVLEQMKPLAPISKGIAVDLPPIGRYSLKHLHIISKQTVVDYLDGRFLTSQLSECLFLCTADAYGKGALPPHE